MKYKHSLIAIILLFCAPVSAEELELNNVKSLRCSFNKGSSATSESGKFKAKLDNKFDDLVFDSINTERRSARIVGNQGSGDIAVLATGTGITFVEQTGSGNLTITTVFHQKPKGFKDYAVIHSRHMDIVGDIMPSQFYGTCKPLE